MFSSANASCFQMEAVKNFHPAASLCLKHVCKVGGCYTRALGLGLPWSFIAFIFSL